MLSSFIFLALTSVPHTDNPVGQVICAVDEGAEAPVNDGSWRQVDVSCEREVATDNPAIPVELLQFYGEPDFAADDALNEHVFRIRLTFTQFAGDGLIIRYDFHSQEDLRTVVKLVRFQPPPGKQHGSKDLTYTDRYQVIEIKDRKASPGFAKAIIDEFRVQSIHEMPSYTEWVYPDGTTVLHNAEGEYYTVEVADTQSGYKAITRGPTLSIQPTFFINLISQLVISSGVPSFYSLHDAESR